MEATLKATGAEQLAFTIPASQGQSELASAMDLIRKRDSLIESKGIEVVAFSFGESFGTADRMSGSYLPEERFESALQGTPAQKYGKQRELARDAFFRAYECAINRESQSPSLDQEGD